MTKHARHTSPRSRIAFKLVVRILAVPITRFAIEGAFATKLIEFCIGVGLCFVLNVCGRSGIASWYTRRPSR